MTLSTPRSRTRRSLYWSIVGRLLAVAAGLFLLLELSARIHLFGLAGLDPRKVESIRLGGFGYLEPSRSPELGWKIRPNVSGYVKLAWFETNSRGLRDREYSVEKPEGVFRVAVVGSSFSMAPGVEIEDVYHSRLEESLGRALAPTRCEFINFAVGAYGPSQILAMLKLEALRFDPDLILFSTTQLSTPGMFGPSDAPPAERMPPMRTHPFLRSFLVEFVYSRAGLGPPPGAGWDLRTGVLERAFLALMGDGASFGEASEASQLFRPGRRRARIAGQGSSVLESLGEVAASTGIPVVLVRLEIESVGKTPLDLRLEARARALGLHFLDTRAAFRGMTASDLWIYPMNPHPNAAAHEIFARVIEDFLLARGLLPDGKTAGQPN